MNIVDSMIRARGWAAFKTTSTGFSSNIIIIIIYYYYYYYYYHFTVQMGAWNGLQ